MTCFVFFDVLPKNGFTEAYFSLAGGLKKSLECILGFRSVERFESLDTPGWFLSFSKWANEDSLINWRCQHDHRQAQICGHNLIFEDYRVRVGSLLLENTEHNTCTENSYIISIVGPFTDMQLAVEEITKIVKIKPRIFQGLTNAKNGMILIDADHNSALKYQNMSEYQIPGIISAIEIFRDYGMFNRSQSPNFYT